MTTNAKTYDVIVGLCAENENVHNETDHAIGSVVFESENRGYQGFLEMRRFLAKNPQWEEYKVDEDGDIHVFFVENPKSYLVSKWEK